MQTRRALLRMLGLILCASAIAAAVGCGDGRKTVPHLPTTGKVTLDGDEKGLAGFVVSFNPDPEKGHTHTRMTGTGQIGSDGSYKINSDDGFQQMAGAPKGWYRVTLLSPNDKPIPANKKYHHYKTTDMFVEVVDPGQASSYNLDFKK